MPSNEVSVTVDVKNLDSVKKYIAELQAEISMLRLMIANLRESTRWIAVDDEPAPKDVDNYGALVFNGECYLVRKPPEVI